MPICLKQRFNMVSQVLHCGANWKIHLNSQEPSRMLVQLCWKSANTWQRDRHSSKPETSFVHWATNEALPRPYITWEKRLIRWGSMQMPGNTSPNPFVFANIWAYLEAILTLLNFSPRSTKRKDATNKRFNSWRQPRPCGSALARRSNKSHRSMSQLYWSAHALTLVMWHMDWHGRKARR